MTTSSPHQPPPPDPQALRQGYEPNAINVRALIWLTVGFIAFGIATHFGLWALLKGDLHRATRGDVPRSLANVPPSQPAVPLQPRPDHDVVPPQDMERLLAHEDELFERLGWQVDRRSHRVMIPQGVAVATTMPATATTAGPTTGPTTRGVR